MRVDILKLRWLIALTLIVNAASMLSPIINEGDSVTYAALSHYIASHNDWVNLLLEGQDWLDKPHFPFWATALAFKVFGISAFSYILPGFVFHLIGGYFTYRIARLFYERTAATLALLVYVSAYHLMYTSSEVKAEAFLTGAIAAACYYWLRFDAQSRLKHLLLGALFSAIAMMTKGVFTLITIGSGLVCMWLYLGQWRRLLHPKWLAALVLTFVFTAPELVALYLQFDSHPEKIIFERTGVSGIRFFLWDSQFGRFFNFGPIKKTEGSHFYYLHVFLWAFLPWVMVFFAAVYRGVRNWPAKDAGQDQGQGVTRKVTQNAALVYLMGSFAITFAMFSATTFQIDYYTVIIFPFAAILCGWYLQRFAQDANPSKALPLVQVGVALFLWSLALGMAVYLQRPLMLAVVLGALCLGVVALMVGRASGRVGGRVDGRVNGRVNGQADWRFVAMLVLPVLGINAVYASIELLAYHAYTTYSIPYNAQKYVMQDRSLPVFVYQLDTINAQELGVYRDGPSFSIGAPSQLPAAPASYYLVVRTAQLPELSPQFTHYEVLAQAQWVDHKTGLLPRMMNIAKGLEPLEAISVVWVKG